MQLFPKYFIHRVKTITAAIITFILFTLISFPFFSRTLQATGPSTKEESYIFPCARTLKKPALSLLHTMGLEEGECTPKGGQQGREEEKGQQEASVHACTIEQAKITEKHKTISGLGLLRQQPG